MCKSEPHVQHSTGRQYWAFAFQLPAVSQSMGVGEGKSESECLAHSSPLGALFASQ